MSIIENYEPEFERECIFVQKVYNECAITDCPTFRIPIPAPLPPATNVVDCFITDIVSEGSVVAPGEVNILVTFNLNVEYSPNGETETIQQTASFPRRRIGLDGAQVGMQVAILPRIQCLTCRPVEAGTAIDCDVGIYIVVKVLALVQLEVLGRFCPQPPECVDVEPLGCPEWFEAAEAGDFWPPFPPQPNRPHR